MSTLNTAKTGQVGSPSSGISEEQFIIGSGHVHLHNSPVGLQLKVLRAAVKKVADHIYDLGISSLRECVEDIKPKKFRLDTKLGAGISLGDDQALWLFDLGMCVLESMPANTDWGVLIRRDGALIMAEVRHTISNKEPVILTLRIMDDADIEAIILEEGQLICEAMDRLVGLCKSALSETRRREQEILHLKYILESQCERAFIPGYRK